jgi:hypothetical protein
MLFHIDYIYVYHVGKQHICAAFLLKIYYTETPAMIIEKTDKTGMLIVNV